MFIEPERVREQLQVLLEGAGIFEGRDYSRLVIDPLERTYTFDRIRSYDTCQGILGAIGESDLIPFRNCRIDRDARLARLVLVDESDKTPDLAGAIMPSDPDYRVKLQAALEGAEDEPWSPDCDTALQRMTWGIDCCPPLEQE